ncbi:MAG: thioester dehydrase [Myxococcaceae bacterium]|nr:thioester dehydrase [Myxococcaceae bacterium]
MSYPSIEQLLPHRAPMLWVDSVISHDGDDVHCRLTLRDSHVFVVNGEADPVVSIEWMAQTVGALVGLFDRSRDEPPRPGYLIAVPEATFLVDVFHVGDVLDLRAHRAWGDDTLASFEAEVERNGELVAKAQLSVYRRKLGRETDSKVFP